MSKTVSVNPALLEGSLRKRFESMLPVIARRSIVQWELCGTAEADIVLREQRLPGDDGISLYISDDAAFDAAPDVLRVERAFRVNAMLEALDLAAARVLHRRDCAARATQRSVAGRSADLYQLKYWSVPGQHAPMNVLCALAGMTRRPVSREWLAAESKLSATEVDVLLVELELRGALRTNLAPLDEPPGRAPAGFMARLKQWLRGPRTATSAGLAR